MKVIRGNVTTWGEHKVFTLDEFYENSDMFQKYTNFNEYPLRVTIFPRYPTALKNTDLPKVFRESYISKETWRADNYSGVDGIMLANAAKFLNFTTKNIPQIGIDFGYKDYSGQFVGNMR